MQKFYYNLHVIILRFVLTTVALHAKYSLLFKKKSILIFVHCWEKGGNN